MTGHDRAWWRRIKTLAVAAAMTVGIATFTPTMDWGMALALVVALLVASSLVIGLDGDWCPASAVVPSASGLMLWAGVRAFDLAPRAAVVVWVVVYALAVLNMLIVLDDWGLKIALMMGMAALAQQPFAEARATAAASAARASFEDGHRHAAERWLSVDSEAQLTCGNRLRGGDLSGLTLGHDSFALSCTLQVKRRCHGETPLLVAMSAAGYALTMRDDGVLVFVVAGQGRRAEVVGTRALNDGQGHAVLALVDRGHDRLVLWVDGAVEASGPGPGPGVSLQTGAPLQVADGVGRLVRLAQLGRVSAAPTRP